MKVRALIALIRARYANLSSQQKPMALLLGGFISALLIWLLVKGLFALALYHKRPTIPVMMIREGKQIIVPENSPLRSHMTIQPVKAVAVPHVVRVPGIIEAQPSRTVNLLPPLTGRLVELKTMQGKVVKKNQLLAVISSPDLAQAYSENDTALSNFTLTKEALNRAKKVNSAGGNSTKDIEVAENNYAQATAELKRTEAKLKTLGNNKFSLLNIKAPISGTISALNYGRGSYITDPTIPLLTISNIKTVWVTANVPQYIIGSIRKEQNVSVKLTAYPKVTLHGKIEFVNPSLDPDTLHNKTRIVFPNPQGRLQPNMFATVDIDVFQPDQILIPLSAILMNDDTTSVYVEISPWVFERRAVELGTEDGDKVRILSGLTVGERIATAGGIFIND